MTIEKFKIGTSNSPNRDINIALSKIHSCSLCSIANIRHSVHPFAPEFLKPIQEIEFALVHQSPMVNDTLDKGVFNSEEPYGVLFDQFLEKIGLTREDLYITSSVFCYNGKKYPRNEDLVTCTTHKYRELRCLTNLKCLFLMGDIALKQIMMDFSLTINDAVGEVYISTINDREFVIVPINHVFHFMIMDDQEWKDNVFDYLGYIKENIVDPILNGENPNV